MHFDDTLYGNVEEIVRWLGERGHLTLESYETKIDGATMVWRCEIAIRSGLTGGFTAEVFDQSPREALQKVQQLVTSYEQMSHR